MYEGAHTTFPVPHLYVIEGGVENFEVDVNAGIQQNPVCLFVCEAGRPITKFHYIIHEFLDIEPESIRHSFPLVVIIPFDPVIVNE